MPTESGLRKHGATNHTSKECGHPVATAKRQNTEHEMQARRYLILALAAGLAGCGSYVLVDEPVQKPAPEPLHESASVLAAEPIPTRYANSPAGPGEFAVEKAMGAKCTEENWHKGGFAVLIDRYCIGEMPQKLQQIMLALPEDEIWLPRHLRQQEVEQPVMLAAVRGLGPEPDLLVETSEWWVRSFGSPDPAKTVYWVSAPFECRGAGYEHVRVSTYESSCRLRLNTSRIYRLIGDGALVDVTLDVLPPDPVISPNLRRHFDQYGGSVLFLDEFKLQYAPVMRLMMDFDADNQLPYSDSHWFVGGAAHFGFLVWNGERFTLEQRVPRRLWPCKPVYPGDPPCSATWDSPTDKFVIGESQSAEKGATHDH